MAMIKFKNCFCHLTSIRVILRAVSTHRKVACITGLIGACLLIWVSLRISFTVTIPDGIHSFGIQPYEPEVNEDFSVDDITEPIIPHIIHQTYKDDMVPLQFAEYVKSFVKQNKRWTYYFWTDKSARQLIADKHPKLLPTWDGYRLPINRGDALRYVVLYEFGGVYADLDVECLRPLDRVTMKYGCIFPTEPFEHSVFRMNQPYILSNALMMCRPQHPFLKQILDNLPLARTFLEQIDTAGPAFVTNQFFIYNDFNSGDFYRFKKDNDSNSPYFYKGLRKETDIDAVYVPNTAYFMGTLDQHHGSEAQYYSQCQNFEQLSDLLKRACVNLKENGFYRRPHKFAYTIHHWYQTYNMHRLANKIALEWFVRKRCIKKLLPHVKYYKNIS